MSIVFSGWHQWLDSHDVQRRNRILSVRNIFHWIRDWPRD